MNFNSVLSLFLACSSANAASTRRYNASTYKSNNASPVLSSCLECRDGFQVSNCSDTTQSDSANVTDPFLGPITNTTVFCLLYTEGTNGERISSTCICEEVTNATGSSQEAPREKQNKVVIDALMTVLVYIAFPAFAIFWCILYQKRRQDGMLNTIQHEADSDDARKQRECVLDIMFPPSEGEKDGSPSQTMSKEPTQTPMSEIDDLEANECRSDDSVINVASCSICLEEIESKSDYGKEIVMGPCSHLHHRECLLNWLKEPGHDSCPDCRQPMWDPKLFTTVKASLVGVQGVYPGPA